MHVEKDERWVLYATAVVIVGAVVGLILSVVVHQAALPRPAGRVQPADIDTTAPFDEPGYRDTGDGTGELVLIGQAWQ